MLLLGGATSQGFWRIVYPSNRKPDQDKAVSQRELPASDFAYRKGGIRTTVPSWLDARFLEMSIRRVEALAFNPLLRRQSDYHLTRIWTGHIPEEAFYDLGNDVFVTSPCFTFLQMATRLNLIELIAYGDELCGRYSFNPASPNGMSQRLIPLVSLRQLVQFVEKTRGCQGHKAAARAIQYIVEDSASPMETVDEMLLCLPYRLGGYGLPTPIMNLPIPLDEQARHIAKRSECRADMCYPAIKLDLEHHGQKHHQQVDDFESDRARVNALKTMDYEVIELTKRQVGDLFAFEEIALHLAKRLGKRIRRPYLGALDTRLFLRETLFDWNRRGGHEKL